MLFILDSVNLSFDDKYHDHFNNYPLCPESISIYQIEKSYVSNQNTIFIKLKRHLYPIFIKLEYIANIYIIDVLMNYNNQNDLNMVFHDNNKSIHIHFINYSASIILIDHFILNGLNLLFLIRIGLQCSQLFFPLKIAQSLNLIDSSSDLQSLNGNSSEKKHSAVGSIKLISMKESNDLIEVDGISVTASLPWWRSR